MRHLLVLAAASAIMLALAGAAPARLPGSDPFVNHCSKVPTPDYPICAKQ